MLLIVTGSISLKPPSIIVLNLNVSLYWKSVNFKLSLSQTATVAQYAESKKVAPWFSMPLIISSSTLYSMTEHHVGVTAGGLIL